MRLLDLLGRVPDPIIYAMFNSVLWTGGGIVYLVLVIWPENVVG